MTRPSALSIADSIAEQYADLRGKFDAADHTHDAEVAFVRLQNWLWDNQRAIIAACANSATVRAAAIAECVAAVEREAVKLGTLACEMTSHEAARDCSLWSDQYRLLAATLRALSPHSPDAKAALVERCAKRVEGILDYQESTKHKFACSIATAVLEELGI